MTSVYHPDQTVHLMDTGTHDLVASVSRTLRQHPDVVRGGFGGGASLEAAESAVALFEEIV